MRLRNDKQIESSSKSTGRKSKNKYTILPNKPQTKPKTLSKLITNPSTYREAYFEIQQPSPSGRASPVPNLDIHQIFPRRNRAEAMNQGQFTFLVIIIIILCTKL